MDEVHIILGIPEVIRLQPPPITATLPSRQSRIKTMRQDFGKCITERPRTKGLGKITRKGYKKRLLKDGLDCVQKEPITRQHSYDKNFTDVLGPIFGFLTKNVGRPWSKVCSEISASLPATGGVSYSHARDHLF